MQERRFLGEMAVRKRPSGIGQVVVSGHTSVANEMLVAMTPTNNKEIDVNAAADIWAAAMPFKIKVSDNNTAAAKKNNWLSSGLNPCSSDSMAMPAIATGKAIQLLRSTLALKNSALIGATNTTDKVVMNPPSPKWVA